MKKRLLTSLLAISMLFVLLPTQAFAVEPTIILGQAVHGDNYKVTYPNLVVKSDADKEYNSATITISGGTVAVTAGSGYGVSYDLSHTTAQVSFNPVKTPEQIQAFLREQVQFTMIPSAQLGVKINIDGNTTNLPSNGVFSAGDGEFGLNGHYYMYVPVESKIGWKDAYSQAKTYQYMGMRGYLVTITSAKEDAILDKLNINPAWSGGARLKPQGGYDAITLGSPTETNGFYWTCGPEAGTEYFTRATTAGTPIGYNNWLSGEPNNSGGKEEGMQVHFSDDSLWNDIPADYKIGGFFVEFGGYAQGSGDSNTAETIEQTDAYVNVLGKVVTNYTGVYKLDVQWGAMTFEYKNIPQVWNPETHKYEEKATNGETYGWVQSGFTDAVGETIGNNAIKVTNHSNGDVKLDFTAKPTALDVQGGAKIQVNTTNMPENTTDATTGTRATDQLLQKVPTIGGNALAITNYLWISGKPVIENTETYKKIATITLTIIPYTDGGFTGE